MTAAARDMGPTDRTFVLVRGNGSELRPCLAEQRAFAVVKLLTRIRKEQPELWVQIQQFAKKEECNGNTNSDRTSQRENAVA